MENEFITYAVYENPTDYPGKFVVRRWNYQTPDETPMIVCDDIETARQVLPKGLFKMPPEPGDDPVIKEIWL